MEPGSPLSTWHLDEVLRDSLGLRVCARALGGNGQALLRTAISPSVPLALCGWLPTKQTGACPPHCRGHCAAFPWSTPVLLLRRSSLICLPQRSKLLHFQAVSLLGSLPGEKRPRAKPSVPGGLKHLFRRTAASFLGGTGMSTSLPLVTSSDTSQLDPRAGDSMAFWDEARMMSSPVDSSVPAAEASLLFTEVTAPGVLGLWPQAPSPPSWLLYLPRGPTGKRMCS